MTDRASGVRGGVNDVVLVLEDDVDIRDAVVELLLDAGHSARAVGTLAEARQFIAHAPPAVLIADLQLPDGSSDELLRELAAAGVHVPTLVMTAAPNGRQIAALHGASYVAKPFCVDELLEETSRLVARVVANVRT